MTGRNLSHNGIPTPVVQRFPHYFMLAERLRRHGVEYVSSTQMAKELGLTSSTVRSDLSYLEFSGMTRRGYSAAQLEAVLRQELGAARTVRVVIVGAGNLGRALAAHEEFARRHFLVCAAFDADPKVIGTRIGEVTVMDMAQLIPVVARQAIEIGIVAVPAVAAQEVAEALVQAGIQGILNLAPAHIHVPAGVAVVDTRIITSLRELAYRIKAPTAFSATTDADSDASATALADDD